MRTNFKNLDTTQYLDSFRDAQGRNWYAMAVYPRGKADKSFWVINLFRVGADHGEVYATADKYLQRKVSLTQLRLC